MLTPFSTDFMNRISQPWLVVVLFDNAYGADGAGWCSTQRQKNRPGGSTSIDS